MWGFLTCSGILRLSLSQPEAWTNFTNSWLRSPWTLLVFVSSITSCFFLFMTYLLYSYFYVFIAFAGSLGLLSFLRRLSSACTSWMWQIKPLNLSIVFICRWAVCTAPQECNDFMSFLVVPGHRCYKWPKKQYFSQCFQAWHHVPKEAIKGRNESWLMVTRRTMRWCWTVFVIVCKCTIFTSKNINYITVKNHTFWSQYLFLHRLLSIVVSLSNILKWDQRAMKDNPIK